MPRSTYHHGALRPALVEAGLDLARAGGAEAVVLREVTRRAGVTVNAAYRHFADREALVDAVSAAALSRLAETIESRIAGLVVSADDPVTDALARLSAVGAGYIEFALAEPGWFDAAFFAVADMELVGDGSAAGTTGRDPFQLLGDALDDLVSAGVLAPAERAGADVFCWSTVHGYAALATRGPLQAVDRDEIDALGRRVVALAVAGCRAGADPATLRLLDRPSETGNEG